VSPIVHTRDMRSEVGRLACKLSSKKNLHCEHRVARFQELVFANSREPARWYRRDLVRTGYTSKTMNLGRNKDEREHAKSAANVLGAARTNLINA
jgi:hypothetical protein